MNPDLLVRLVLDATSEAAQRRVGALSLMTRGPVIDAQRNDPYWAPALRTIADGATSLPRRGYAHLAADPVERYGIAAVRGEMSAKEALDRAAAEYLARARVEGLVK